MVMDGENTIVAVGRIGRPYGVRGWVHVHSDMDPPSELLEQKRWWVGPVANSVRGASEPNVHGPWAILSLDSVRAHNQGVVALATGVDSREGAQALTGRVVGLPRAALPALDDDEFYWVDLLGCDVVNANGVFLGTVESFLETGANDVMVLSGMENRLIPFLMGEVVTQVDSTGRRILVDWDETWVETGDETGDEGSDENSDARSK
jgi:16S rRNA processing protein RimM